MAPLSLRGIDPRVPSNRVVCGSCEWRSESHREPQCKKDTSTRCLLYGLHYACDVQRVCGFETLARATRRCEICERVSAGLPGHQRWLLLVLGRALASSSSLIASCDGLVSRGWTDFVAY